MSGSKGGVSVVVTVLDRASKQIDAINKRLNAMQRPVRALWSQVQRFGQLSGITKLAGGFQNLARRGLALMGTLSKIAAPLSALTSALTLAGIVKLATEFAEVNSQLGFTAQRLGIVPAQLQALQGAAQFAGSSAQGLTSGLGNLGGVLVDAVAGRAPEAVLMMNTLGIALRDNVTGGARKALDVLPELADKVAAIKDPFLQARAATAFFGGAAEDMLPFLRAGSVGITEYTALAKHFNSSADVEKANNLRKAQVALNLAVQGLTNTIGAALAPVLGPMLLQLAEFIKLNGTAVGTKLTELVKFLGDKIGSVDWKGVITDIESLARSINRTVEGTVGWSNAFKILLGIGIFSFFSGLLVPIAQVSAALIALTFSNPFTASIAGAVALGALLGKFYSDYDSHKSFWENVKSETGIKVTHDAPPPSDEQKKGWLYRWTGGLLGYTGPKAPSADAPASGLPAAAAPPVAPSGPANDNQDPFARFKAPSGGKASGYNLSPETESELRSKAAAMGLDPNHMVALARAEHGDRDSPVGAMGTMQLMARTAREMGVDPRDPHENITGGLGYYKKALDKFKGNYAAADAAYNAGPNSSAVANFAGTGNASILPNETQRYVATIAANAAQGAASTVGGGAGAAAGATTVKGSANVNIKLSGAPPGTKVTSNTEGDLFPRAPRVQQAMGGDGI